MLTRAHRLRSSASFTRTVKRGVRRGRPAVVVHAYDTHTLRPTQVGFVVAKPVGNAVVRNRVKRRLRHLVAAHLPTTPCGLEVVVRALPAAAVQPDRLAGDLDATWTQVMDVLGVSRPGMPEAEPRAAAREARLCSEAVTP